MLIPRLLLLTLVLPTPLFADVPAEQQREVTHLINFVSTSDCELIRNGQPHQGSDAAAHIRKKYDYFRGEIKNTKTFIELAASKSTTSGRDYSVRCPKQPEMKSRDWLLRELERYRHQQP